MGIEERSRSLAQPTPLGLGELVEQRTVFLYGSRAWGFLLALRFRMLHSICISCFRGRVNGRKALLAWVEFRVRLFQIGDGEAQVALGRGERLMAKQVLDMAEAGMVLDQVSGTGMAPHVRRYGLPDASRPGVLLH